MYLFFFYPTMGTDPSNITAKSNNQSKQTKINISKGSHPKHTYSTGKTTIIKHKTSGNLHFYTAKTSTLHLHPLHFSMAKTSTLHLHPLHFYTANNQIRPHYSLLISHHSSLPSLHTLFCLRYSRMEIPKRFLKSVFGGAGFFHPQAAVISAIVSSVWRSLRFTSSRRTLRIASYTLSP